MNAQMYSLQNSILYISPQNFSHQKSPLNGLKTGDIISGKIIDFLSQSKYIMRIKGQDIIAESQTQLQPGSIYSLRVQSLYPTVSLKIHQNVSHINPEYQIVQLLKQFNIQNTTITRLIVQQLHTLELPITQETVNSILGYLENVNKRKYSNAANKTQIRSMLLLNQKNIPVNSKTIALAERLIQDNILFGNTLTHLFKEPAFIDFIGNRHHLLSELYEYFKYERTRKNTNGVAQYVKALVRLSSSSVYQKIIQLLVNNFDQLSNNPQYSNLILAILEFLAGLQHMRIINGKSDDFYNVLYFPLVLMFNSKPINIELFYQKVTEYAENDDRIPGFYINLFITIDDTSPLHIALIKKVPYMLTIQFHHPNRNNIEILRNKNGLLKKMIRQLDYKSIKLTYHITDTDHPDYRSTLFFPHKSMIRSINISG